jgi:hypothetical protein
MVDEKKKDEAREKVNANVAKKGKQLSLPGMENEKNAELERAIDKYCEARDARMAAGEVEVEMKEKLISIAKKRRLSRYKRGPFSLEIETKDKVKARNAKDEKEE